MHARATLLEIDMMRTSVDDALAVFEREVLPQLHAQSGYQGVIVMTTPDGKGMLVTLWSSSDAAAAEVDRGFYAETLARYMTLFRSAPDRQRYEVVFAETPALSVA